jgi:hypothetical protein
MAMYADGEPPWIIDGKVSVPASAREFVEEFGGYDHVAKAE